MTQHQPTDDNLRDPLSTKLELIYRDVLKREDGALDPQRLIALRASLRWRRLYTGVGLLVLSALLILSIYLFLPILAAGVVRAAQGGLSAEAEAIEDAVSTLTAEKLTKLEEDISALRDGTVQMRNAFDSPQLEAISDAANRAATAVAQIAGRTDLNDIQVQLKRIDVQLEPWLPVAADDGTHTPAPAVVALNRIPTPRSVELSDPGAVITALRALPARIDALRTAEQAMDARLVESIRRKRADGKWRDFEPYEKDDVLAIITEAQALLEDSSLVATLQTLANAAGEVEQGVTIVDPRYVSLANQLNEIRADMRTLPSQLSGAAEAFTAAAEQVDGAIGTIPAALGPVGEDAGGATTLEVAVADLTLRAKELQGFLPDVASAAADVKLSAANAKQAVSTIQESASVGTGPVTFVILAIAGMCATLGVSALWRWMRSAEDERGEIDAHVNAMILAQVAGTLVDAGVDQPAAILELIERQMRGPSAKSGGGTSLPTPTSRALEEAIEIGRDILKKVEK